MTLLEHQRLNLCLLASLNDLALQYEMHQCSLFWCRRFNRSSAFSCACPSLALSNAPMHTTFTPVGLTDAGILLVLVQFVAAVIWTLQIYTICFFTMIWASRWRIGHFGFDSWDLEFLQIWYHKLVSHIDYIVTQSPKSQEMGSCSLQSHASTFTPSRARQCEPTWNFPSLITPITWWNGHSLTN